MEAKTLAGILIVIVGFAALLVFVFHAEVKAAGVTQDSLEWLFDILWPEQVVAKQNVENIQDAVNYVCNGGKSEYLESIRRKDQVECTETGDSAKCDINLLTLPQNPSKYEEWSFGTASWTSGSGPRFLTYYEFLPPGEDESWSKWVSVNLVLTFVPTEYLIGGAKYVAKGVGGFVVKNVPLVGNFIQKISPALGSVGSALSKFADSHILPKFGYKTIGVIGETGFIKLTMEPSTLTAIKDFVLSSKVPLTSSINRLLMRPAMERASDEEYAKQIAETFPRGMFTLEKMDEDNKNWFRRNLLIWNYLWEKSDGQYGIEKSIGDEIYKKYSDIKYTMIVLSKTPSIIDLTTVQSLILFEGINQNAERRKVFEDAGVSQDDIEKIINKDTDTMLAVYDRLSDSALSNLLDTFTLDEFLGFVKKQDEQLKEFAEKAKTESIEDPTNPGGLLAISQTEYGQMLALQTQENENYTYLLENLLPRDMGKEALLDYLFAQHIYEATLKLKSPSMQFVFMEATEIEEEQVCAKSLCLEIKPLPVPKEYKLDCNLGVELTDGDYDGRFYLASPCYASLHVYKDACSSNEYGSNDCVKVKLAEWVDLTDLSNFCYTPHKVTIAGAAAGASTGASIGFTIGTLAGPGPGNLVGAGIGGVIGGIIGAIAPDFLGGGLVWWPQHPH